jgi:hypothetical protein
MLRAFGMYVLFESPSARVDRKQRFAEGSVKTTPSSAAVALQILRSNLIRVLTKQERQMIPLTPFKIP